MKITVKHNDTEIQIDEGHDKTNLNYHLSEIKQLLTAISESIKSLNAK